MTITRVATRAHLVHEPDRSIAVDLSYDPADPHAVTATFHAPGEEPTTWQFARDLLRDGLDAHTGLGDVQAWPMGDQWVALSLSSPDGDLCLRLPRHPVERLVRAAYRLVHDGAEACDVDAAIARLLANHD